MSAYYPSPAIGSTPTKSSPVGSVAPAGQGDLVSSVYSMEGLKTTLELPDLATETTVGSVTVQGTSDKLEGAEMVSDDDLSFISTPSRSASPASTRGRPMTRSPSPRAAPTVVPVPSLQPAPSAPLLHHLGGVPQPPVIQCPSSRSSSRSTTSRRRCSRSRSPRPRSRSPPVIIQQPPQMSIPPVPVILPPLGRVNPVRIRSPERSPSRCRCRSTSRSRSRTPLPVPTGVPVDTDQRRSPSPRRSRSRDRRCGCYATGRTCTRCRRASRRSWTRSRSRSPSYSPRSPPPMWYNSGSADCPAEYMGHTYKALRNGRLETSAPYYVPHPKYHFDDGSLLVHIEGTEYRIHHSVLTQQSRVFKASLEGPLAGCSPNRVLCIRPTNVTKAQLDTLLYRLYPQFEPVQADTWEKDILAELKVVLKLAIRWRMDALCTRASNELEQFTSPVDRILVVREIKATMAAPPGGYYRPFSPPYIPTYDNAPRPPYVVPPAYIPAPTNSSDVKFDWAGVLLRALRELSIKGHALDRADANKLGMETAMGIWESQDYIRRTFPHAMLDGPPTLGYPPAPLSVSLSRALDKDYSHINPRDMAAIDQFIGAKFLELKN